VAQETIHREVRSTEELVDTAADSYDGKNNKEERGKIGGCLDRGDGDRRKGGGAQA